MRPFPRVDGLRALVSPSIFSFYRFYIYKFTSVEEIQLSWIELVTCCRLLCDQTRLSHIRRERSESSSRLLTFSNTEICKRLITTLLSTVHAERYRIQIELLIWEPPCVPRDRFIHTHNFFLWPTVTWVLLPLVLRLFYLKSKIMLFIMLRIQLIGVIYFLGCTMQVLVSQGAEPFSAWRLSFSESSVLSSLWASSCLSPCVLWFLNTARIPRS